MVSDEVISIGRDGTGRDPLQHAIMAAVDAAAARNVRLWPDPPEDGLSGHPSAWHVIMQF